MHFPEDVYKIVKSHKEVPWSEIARRAIEDYAKKVSLLNAMTSQSELTQDHIMVLDQKIKSGVHQIYKNKTAQRTGRKQDSS